ncbi:MAG: carbohydrate ABC transporter permease, partial [Nocardioidaceae bacterium]
MSRAHAIKAMRTTLALLIAIPFLAPFAFLLNAGLRTEHDYLASPFGLPDHLTLDNLTAAWSDAQLGPALVASLITSGIAVLVAASCATSAGFWFFTHRGRGATMTRWTLTAGYVFPAIIWLVPLFVLLARNGFTNNLVVLGIIYGVSNVPFGLYFISAFYGQTLAGEVLEAAALDGAGRLRQFRLIALPLARPAMAALSALVFVWSFGDLLFAVTLLQDPDKWTVTIAAATLSTQDGISVQAQAAG